jgi:hypothetical protein
MKQIQLKKSSRKSARSGLDRRTPSGRRLPF